MNTADRSLTMVDYALRRRFAFIDLHPAFSSIKLRDYLINVEKLDTRFVSKLASNYTKLNEFITDKIGKGFIIGHSYFIGQFNNSTDIDVSYKNIVEYEIKPLLEEYFFDDQTRIDEAMTIIDFKVEE